MRARVLLDRDLDEIINREEVPTAPTKVEAEGIPLA